jgi:hypothetical protein
MEKAMAMVRVKVLETAMATVRGKAMGKAMGKVLEKVKERGMVPGWGRHRRSGDCL